MTEPDQIFLAVLRGEKVSERATLQKECKMSHNVEDSHCQLWFQDILMILLLLPSTSNCQ